MINGAIEEQMRGIQIVAEPINQRNCALGGGSTMRNLVSVQAGMEGGWGVKIFMKDIRGESQD